MADVGSSDNSSVTLNLYPMMDVFSILITFLLMSFSADPVSYQVNPANELPDSKTLTSLDEVPTIVVTRTDVFVNDKKVTSIQNNDIVEKDRDQGAIRPLYDELMKIRENMNRLKPKNAKESTTPKKEESTLTMEMHKDDHFQIMRRIMLSGQQAEFFAFKLMAAKEDF